MSRARRSVGVALSTFALTVAAVAVAAPAHATVEPYTTSWASAITDGTSRAEFDTATLNLTTQVAEATRLQIVTSGFGHVHGAGLTTLSVQILPSGTIVWSRALDAFSSHPMALDIPLPGSPSVTGITITSLPPQGYTFHGFSEADTVTVYGERCPERQGSRVCAHTDTGTLVQEVVVGNPGTTQLGDIGVVGRLDVYKLPLPTGGSVNVTCPVLYVEPKFVNPCAATNAQYVSTFATLYDDDVVLTGANLSGALVRARVCNARLTITVNDAGVEDIPILALC